MGVYTGTLPSGTHAAGAGLPAAWTQQVGLSITALGSAWPTYTPTLTGFTLGNGTITGRYLQVGKKVEMAAVMTFGSTSAAAAAAPTITLPVSALTANFGDFTVLFVDASPGDVYFAVGYQAAIGTIGCYISGTSGKATAPTTTTPFTWTTGDSIYVRGTYEAA